MAVFAYRAMDEAETEVDGVVVAETPRQARDQLRDRGLTVETVTERSARRSLTWWQRRMAHRQTPKVSDFIRELSTLLGVGVPLLEALDALAQQHKGPFAESILALRDRVSAGSGISQAMADQPALYDPLCISLTEVGENSGNLDAILARLAEFRDRSALLRGRLIGAMLYPAIVLAMAVAVSVAMMTLVVPKLLASLVDAGRPLPWTTRMVKAASDLLVARWWLLILLAAGVFALLAVMLSTETGRRRWHRLQLRIPVVGSLARKQMIVRLVVVLAVLLRSGVAFIKAIELARRGTSNLVLREALTRCHATVGAGRDIALALRETGAFPPMVVQVFSVGQQSGRLEEMLERLAVDYDQQVTLAAQRLTAVLEPLLILFLVVVVGFIALATIQPMLEAANVL